MAKRIIIRHAQSEYNIGATTNLDSNITDQGRYQIDVTADYLKTNVEDINEFIGIVSPYTRTLQTADVLHKKLGMDFLVSPGPREIMTDYEICTVVNKKCVFEQFAWSFDGDMTIYKETVEEYIERMRDFVESINHHDKILIISHGTPCSTLKDLFVGLPPSADTETYVANCSITHIQDDKVIFFGKVVYN